MNLQAKQSTFGARKRRKGIRFSGTLPTQKLRLNRHKMWGSGRVKCKREETEAFDPYSWVKQLKASHVPSKYMSNGAARRQ